MLKGCDSLWLVRIYFSGYYWLFFFLWRYECNQLLMPCPASVLGCDIFVLIEIDKLKMWHLYFTFLESSVLKKVFHYIWSGSYKNRVILGITAWDWTLHIHFVDRFSAMQLSILLPCSLSYHYTITLNALVYEWHIWNITTITLKVVIVYGEGK